MILDLDLGIVLICRTGFGQDLRQNQYSRSSIVFGIITGLWPTTDVIFVLRMHLRRFLTWFGWNFYYFDDIWRRCWSPWLFGLLLDLGEISDKFDFFKMKIYNCMKTQKITLLRSKNTLAREQKHYASCSHPRLPTTLLVVQSRDAEVPQWHCHNASFYP